MAPLTADPILAQDDPTLPAATRILSAVRTFRAHYEAPAPESAVLRLPMDDETCRHAISRLVIARLLVRVPTSLGAGDLDLPGFAPHPRRRRGPRPGVEFSDRI